MVAAGLQLMTPTGALTTTISDLSSWGETLWLYSVSYNNNGSSW